MTIPDDMSPEDHLRELNRQEAELREQLDDLETSQRRRNVRDNILWFLAGIIAGFRGKSPPQEPDRGPH